MAEVEEPKTRCDDRMWVSAAAKSLGAKGPICATGAEDGLTEEPYILHRRDEAGSLIEEPALQP